MSFMPGFPRSSCPGCDEARGATRVGTAARDFPRMRGQSILPRRVRRAQQAEPPRMPHTITSTYAYGLDITDGANFSPLSISAAGRITGTGLFLGGSVDWTV